MSWTTKPLVAGDVEIVKRVLAHVDGGTTDEGTPWREPVENYVNPNRFAQELDLLRSMPSVFVPSAIIPNKGDRVERAAFGVPLFAVRGHDQRARVFRNACRHRGFALVEDAGCSHALVCRYHGWTYRLDGALSHVPHADGFPDLDMSTRGLIEVESYEADGLIVIGALDSGGTSFANSDLDDALDWLTDATPWRDKFLPAERLISVESSRLAINWKVLIEQFLEGYHIRWTHKETLPHLYDNLTVVEAFGPNARVTFPYRSIEQLRDHPETTWQGNVPATFVYQLFPNVILGAFPQLGQVVVVDPIDVDHSQVTFYTMARTDADQRLSLDAEPEPDPEEIARYITRVVAEDNEMSAGVQRGFRAGANKFVEFGRHESAIGHFHATLSDRLARFIATQA
ncbi:aromatic ring-hydroxylating dioxygenase subunit alpha [Mycobacterium lacus]|uniref:(2Fe-2S) ferredoxin n=1 Tax=Mycobacterium lacus TaxID=169765 RepID=A0A1X1XXQ3_9MYCO|nr:aromatic ring-hydroxylating dioxygenase subunit alpha [Mycobacterium lacus]MCV7125820.1 aromatic ring-hydroxylating dioxygenase subunit alpha [Mycobacterium lacus]ORW03544.1 ring-hydroxylating oxygenase subunit alpha [Mycobacterium lacus]BBX96731.1 (2Fe-2S) ferredoxin [Mycobacterium lacus]